MIKVTVGPVASACKKYPYIGTTDNNCVVLFYAPNEGVCISSSIPGEVGKVEDDWHESHFTCVLRTVIESEI